MKKILLFFILCVIALMSISVTGVSSTFFQNNGVSLTTSVAIDGELRVYSDFIEFEDWSGYEDQVTLTFSGLLPNTVYTVDYIEEIVTYTTDASGSLILIVEILNPYYYPIRMTW